MLDKMGEVEFYCDDLGKIITVKEWLKCLLLELWVNGEGFSGKRPFGNSGWEINAAIPLIREGFLKGSYEVDEDGDIADYEFDRKEYNKLIANFIKEM